MAMIHVLSVVAVTVLGLPVGASLAARAHGGRMLGRAMPFWYVGSLILVAALAVLAWGTQTSALSLTGAALLAASVVLSITVLVPINNRSVTWTTESHPADWREQSQRWDRFHYARVAIIVAAFVVVVMATVL
jgi:hypothetical protein